MNPGDHFELPGEGEAFHVKRSPSHGDPALQFDWTLQPKKPGPPVHAHPDEDEIVRVVEGTARVRLGDEIQLVDAGKSLRIPAGTPHQIRGHGDTPLVIQVTYSPGHGFEQVLDLMQRGGFRGFAAMCQFVTANPQILRPYHLGIRVFMRVVGGLGRLVGVRAPAARAPTSAPQSFESVAKRI